MNQNHKFCRSLLLLVSVLTPSLYSQDTVEDQIFELSAFEVSATEDQGYVVNDTNSATRFSLQKKDIPFTITTLSASMLEDAGAIDAIESLDLSSSATPTENVFTGNNNRPTIRGTSSPRFFVEGMFYNSTVAPGGVAVDRIEVLKGTSSMLYGQGEPGGTVNYTLKKPLKDPQGRVQFMVGSHQEKNTELDYSAPLNKEGTLSVRFGYEYYYGENQHDRYSSEKHDVFTRVRWEYDGFDRYIDIWNTYSNVYNTAIVQHILDEYHGITNLQMKRFIFTRFTSDDLPNPLDLGMMDPQSHNDTAEGSFAEVKTMSTTATLNHRINDTFVFRSSYNHTNMPRYLWRNLADPTRAVERQDSRQYLVTDPETGMPSILTTQRGDIIKNTGGRLRDDALVSDSFVANLLGEFRFNHLSWKTVLGFDHISEVFRSESWYSNWHYEQLGNGTAQLKDYGGRIPVILGNVFEPEAGLTAESEPLSTYTIHSGYSENENVGAGYYWTNFFEILEGKVSFVTSVRRDEGEIKTDSLRSERTDGEDPKISGDPADYDSTTYSTGGNWHFLENFGIFANYAKSFRPEVSLQTGRDQQPIPPGEREPFEGKGWDLGMKYSSDEGKVFAMVSAFETRKQNIWGRTEGQAIDQQGNLLWEDVDETIPTMIHYDVQTGEELVRGVEMELNAELFEDLELRLGWTYMWDARVSADEREFVVGQRLRRSPEHKIVGGVKYHIRSGPLSYAQFGVNVTSLIDDRVYWVGTSNTELNVGHLGENSPWLGEPDRFWGEGYTKFDIFASKRIRFEGKGVDLWIRLHIYNVLDVDYQRYRKRGKSLSGRFTLDFRW